MQHSSITFSPLTALLGLEPAGVPGGRRGPAADAGDEAFAALLASIGASAGGEALPADGKVLPLDAASAWPAPPDVRSVQAEVAVPSAESAAADPRPPMPRLVPAPAQGSVPFAAAGALPAQPGAVGADAAQARPFPLDPYPPGPPRASAVPHAAPLPADGGDVPAPAPSAAEGSDPAPSAPVEHRAGPEGLRPAAPQAAAAVRAAGAEISLDGPSAAGEALVRTEEHGEPDAPTGLARVGPRAFEPPRTEPVVTPAAPPAPAVMPADAAADVHSASARTLQDAPVDARAAPPELGESMAGRIRLMIDHGAGEARLRLDPPELGTIDVRISVVDDKTFVHMTASHAAGRDALEQSLPRLRELLAAGGLDFGGASVDGGGRDTGPEAGPYRADPPYAFPEEPAGAAASSSTAVRAPVSAAGRIDLFA